MISTVLCGVFGVNIIRLFHCKADNNANADQKDTGKKDREKLTWTDRKRFTHVAYTDQQNTVYIQTVGLLFLIMPTHVKRVTVRNN